MAREASCVGGRHDAWLPFFSRTCNQTASLSILSVRRVNEEHTGILPLCTKPAITHGSFEGLFAFYGLWWKSVPKLLEKLAFQPPD